MQNHYAVTMHKLISRVTSLREVGGKACCGEVGKPQLCEPVHLNLEKELCEGGDKLVFLGQLKDPQDGSVRDAVATVRMNFCICNTAAPAWPRAAAGAHV